MRECAITGAIYNLMGIFSSTTKSYQVVFALSYFEQNFISHQNKHRFDVEQCVKGLKQRE